MDYPINFNELTSDIEFYTEVVKLQDEAKNYLLSFEWCKQILNSNLYVNIGSVFCIFLFEIENSSSIDDKYIWLVVGDIPPMYLDTHGAGTTKEVLEAYIRLAEDWINHVKSGISVKNCYPFNNEPTIEMANLLEKRTNFMKNTLIDNIDDIAVQGI